MIQKDKTYNLATFFCLYIAQTIPMSFFSTVIPVMMRQEDFSLSAIGLLQLIKLPLDPEIPLVADGRPPCRDDGRL